MFDCRESRSTSRFRFPARWRLKAIAISLSDSDFSVSEFDALLFKQIANAGKDDAPEPTRRSAAIMSDVISLSSNSTPTAATIFQASSPTRSSQPSAHAHELIKTSGLRRTRGNQADQRTS